MIADRQEAIVVGDDVGEGGGHGGEEIDQNVVDSHLSRR
jgi:hypothetical protein